MKSEKPIAVDETGKFIFAYNEYGIPVCNSRKRCKPDWDRCKNSFVGANGRCRLHGMKSLSGRNHPNMKHLRYSHVVQRDLQRLVLQWQLAKVRSSDKTSLN